LQDDNVSLGDRSIHNKYLYSSKESINTLLEATYAAKEDGSHMAIGIKLVKINTLIGRSHSVKTTCQPIHSASYFLNHTQDDQSLKSIDCNSNLAISSGVRPHGST